MSEQYTLNLYTGYKKAVKAQSDVKLVNRWYIPILVTILICAVAFIGMQYYAGTVEADLQAVVDWTTDPTNLEAYDHSIERQEYNQTIIADIEEVEKLNNKIAAYPMVDSSLMNQVSMLGGDKVSNVVTGYDATTGALLFEARSKEVIDIPEYIAMMENTDFFAAVTYLGYEYEDEVYTLELGGILKTSLGK